MATVSKKYAVLISLHASVILLCGMLIFISQTAQTTGVTFAATTEAATPPLPPTNDSGLAFTLILIGLVASFSVIRWANKGGMARKAGTVGGWFTNLFTSTDSNKKLWRIIRREIYVMSSELDNIAPAALDQQFPATDLVHNVSAPF